MIYETMTLKDSQLYINNHNEFMNTFGHEILETALNGFKRYSFASTTYVEINSYLDTRYKELGYEEIKRNFNHKFKEYKGQWGKRRN